MTVRFPRQPLDRRTQRNHQLQHGVALHHRTAKRRAVTGLATVLLAGCGSPGRAVDRVPAVRNDRAVAPDSGVLRDHQGQAQWTSVVERGRIREIVERVALFGALRGERRYTFDSLGTLRQLTERVGGGTGSATTHVSLVEFRAGVPALATRDINGIPAPFAREEMLRLQSRGYALSIPPITRPRVDRHPRAALPQSTLAAAATCERIARVGACTMMACSKVRATVAVVPPARSVRDGWRQYRLSCLRRAHGLTN